MQLSQDDKQHADSYH